jgi:hypothetical protein
MAPKRAKRTDLPEFVVELGLNYFPRFQKASICDDSTATRFRWVKSNLAWLTCGREEKSLAGASTM